MDSFRWTEVFATGIDQIDGQHHHLVALVNRFGDLITEGEVSAASTEEIYGELASYAVQHFTDEEQLMASSGIAEEFILQHKSEHERFLAEVVRMRAIRPDNSPDAASSLLKFLIHWLAYHILGMDQSMARQMGCVEDGMEATRAYALETEDSDDTRAPLTEALHGLFSLVSQRNNELVELNRSLEDKVAERTKELVATNRELRALSQQLEVVAITDVLTGLPNRRHAIACLERLWGEAGPKPLSCIMVDADHFKAVNDTHGHDAGDIVLQELSAALRDSVRNDDIVCRLGGDEFFIICPYTPGEAALQVAAKVHGVVAQMKVDVGTGVWHGSISVGVGSREASMGNLIDMMKVADKGVYAAKRDGKNCVRDGRE